MSLFVTKFAIGNRLKTLIFVIPTDNRQDYESAYLVNNETSSRSDES